MADIGRRKKTSGSLADAKRYYELAEDYFDKRDYEKAIENYNMAILLNPLFSEAYFGRALAYYKLKEYDKAIADYTKVIELDPKNPIVYNNRGDVYYRKGDFGTAIKDYDRAIMFNQNYMKAYYNRGLCYASLEQYDKAIEDFSKVTELKPDFAEAYHLRGLAKEYNDDLDGAIDDYNKSLELKPDLIEAKAHLDAAKAKKEQSGKEGKKGSSDIKMVERPNMSFKDVAGMDKVKETIREAIIYPLQDPDLARQYGKLGGGGVLLYGPPGCGKTYIVKAAAGEIGSAFINAKLSDLLDMYVGNTEKNIHKVFELSRKNSPAILFFDEIDAIGGRRGEGEQSQAMRMAVNQLLYEMDGIEANNENVLVIAATNAPWDVDPALRRSGRFTKAIYISEPDLKSRMAIFKLHSRNRFISKHIAWFRLGLATSGYSAADIKAIVDEAATYPWKEAHLHGKKRPITTGDLIKAVKKRKSSLPPWYGQANKQIGKQEEVTWIDGKKHIKYVESKLGPEEREQFSPLIKEIKRRNGLLFKIETTVLKNFALYVPIPI
ncbi:MAG: AAA family ATPase [Methanobacteriota archaeon]|nr:MAG: AAA family ATPase [Euryarchaeota archaeon]